MTLTDVVTAHGAVVLASAEVATAIADGVKPQLAQLQALFKRYEVRAEGNSLALAFEITEAQLEMIVKLATAQSGN